MPMGFPGVPGSLTPWPAGLPSLDAALESRDLPPLHASAEHPRAGSLCPSGASLTLCWDVDSKLVSLLFASSRFHSLLLPKAVPSNVTVEIQRRHLNADSSWLRLSPLVSRLKSCPLQICSLRGTEDCCLPLTSGSYVCLVPPKTSPQIERHLNPEVFVASRAAAADALPSGVQIRWQRMKPVRSPQRWVSGAPSPHAYGFSLTLCEHSPCDPISCVSNCSGQFFVMMSPQEVLQGGAQRSIAPRNHPYSPKSEAPRTTRDEKRRAQHNEVERRRRDKINNWIVQLSKIIPDCSMENTKSGQSKGGILSKACDYIQELRQSNHRLSEELQGLDQLQMDNDVLRQQVEDLKNKNLILRAQLRQHGVEIIIKNDTH
ncbi:upstream stimulatory factor 1 isoform 1-T1 [Pangshura tecta]